MDNQDFVYRAITPGRPSVPMDDGDAPDTYGTLYTNNGCRHVAGGPHLGDPTGSPDSELDGHPSAFTTAPTCILSRP